MPKLTDYSGQRYGKLVFQKKSDIRNNGGDIKWELLCDCGNITYCTVGNIKSGRTKSCGCLDYENKHTSGRISRKHDPLKSSALTVWHNTYNDGDVDFDTFFELSQQDCFYCGRKPYTTYNVSMSRKSSELQKSGGNFIYNGLDRVDSAKGHDKNNVVPCCYQCNRMKLDATQKDFLQNVKMIYKHLFRIS